MRLPSHSRDLLAQLETADNTPLIRDSWLRCLDTYRLEPDRVPEPDVLTQSEFGAARAATEALAALSKGELDRMLRQLGDHVHLLLLADAQGTLIVSRCEPALQSACVDACILPGASFTERSQGTNGIGLCIQERSPVSVVMEDHFATRLVGLSCTVAPIFGPCGDLAAVLNVTSLRPSSRTVHEIARRVVENSARRIENRAFDLRCAGRTVLRLSLSGDFCDPAGEGRVALDDEGRVVDLTPAAMNMLGIRAHMIGQRLAGIEDLDVLGRMLRTANPAIDTHQGRVNIALSETSSRLAPGGGAPSFRVEAPRTQVPLAGLGLDEIAGNDPGTVEQLSIARRLFNRGIPILLHGESGTGKTMLARALHDAGPTRSGKFVAINCAAIPAELIESELFGYRPGAFTGAARSGSRGRLLEADGGTLFLDEVGDMPLALQSRLLQVLSEKTFVPVGATQPVRVDFRVVSASFRSIKAMVDERQFRQDLYYRIQGATLSLAALRHRSDREQIIDSVLIRAALEAGMEAPRLSADVRRCLLHYDWPGNIRELQHVAGYALALCDESELTMTCLPPYLRDSVANFQETGSASDARRDSRNVETILAELTACDWNVTLTARRLGISRATLHRRMKDMQLKRLGENRP